MSGEVLKIVIYHGGVFFGPGREIYSGRKIEEVGQMNVDYISIGEIGHAVKGLGYSQTGNMWYTFDDEDWVGVRTFKRDSDVIEMINRSRIEKRKVLNIYVEHEIDKTDFVGEDISEGGDHEVHMEGLGEGVGGEGFHGEGLGEGLDGEGVSDGLGEGFDALGLNEDLGGRAGEDDNDVEGEREEGSDYGKDLSDFLELHDDEPDAYEDVRNEEDANGDTAVNVDWLGAFTSTTGGGEDGGVESEYEAEDLRSRGGSESDDGPRLRNYPEFTQNMEEPGEVTLMQDTADSASCH